MGATCSKSSYAGALSPSLSRRGDGAAPPPLSLLPGDARPALTRLEAVGASEGVAVENLGGAVGLELLRGALAARGVELSVGQDGRLARLVLVGLSGLAYV